MSDLIPLLMTLLCLTHCIRVQNCCDKLPLNNCISLACPVGWETACLEALMCTRYEPGRPSNEMENSAVLMPMENQALVSGVSHANYQPVSRDIRWVQRSWSSWTARRYVRGAFLVEVTLSSVLKPAAAFELVMHVVRVEFSVTL